MLEWDLCNEACGAMSQDRAAILEAGQAHIAIIADGAGGIGGGREAADAVPRLVEELRPSLPDAREPDFWVRALAQADLSIESDAAAGETTAIVAAAAQGALVGASVGDSEAFLFTESRFTDLTARQVRKPLLGSGSATPVPFGPTPFEGTLVMASDGLFKHATVNQIWGLLQPSSLGDIVASLVALARLPSGALPDDVSVIVARPR